MHVVGLITEYNPFHNGHLYHLNKSKEITGADYSIAVMSGNYVQRGCPAYVDKWSRARMALEAGVDMVIEIPTYYSTASAELFSFGSIALLHHTGIVNSVCFGSEIGKTELIEDIATLLAQEPFEYQQLLKEALSSGNGFATSRTKALYNYLKAQDHMDLTEEVFTSFISSPNNILGIEYIKWIKKLGSSIKPATIQRKTTGYHEQSTTQPIASASGIRNLLNKNKSLEEIMHTIPKGTLDELLRTFKEGIGPNTFNDYSSLLHYAISMAGPIGIEKMMEVSEGLENRIYQKSQRHFLIDELLDSLGTKRYTNSRLSRTLLYTMLGITKERFQHFHQQGGPQYIKVLGFRRKSEVLFSHLKEKATLPLITNMGRHLSKLPVPAYEMIMDESRFSDIYSLGYANTSQQTKQIEFQQPLIVI